MLLLLKQLTHYVSDLLQHLGDIDGHREMENILAIPGKCC